MRKLMAGLALVVVAAAFAASPVAAEDGNCAIGYNTCLNDTWMLTGAAQTMADIECFADYLGCLKDSLLT